MPDTPDLLLIENIELVRVLTLNRPDKANAFNERLYHAAAVALREAEADESVSVVVFTGAGRVFSGGVDITEMTAVIPEEGQLAATPQRPAEASSMSRGFDAFVNALSSFPKPVIAAVNGAAVGIGFTMLLHCDLVLVSENARLRAPFTRMGVAPEAASSYLLPRRAGRQRAALALFTSDWIQPEEAVACGLAVKVCPADRLVAEAVELASRIAEHPLPSLMATKRLVLDAEREGILRARELEGQEFSRLLQLPNARDRVAAQLDKTS
ncbi:MAG: enoyl-CoA hydratase-related protein [Acidimicrobiia bacterium]